MPAGRGERARAELRHRCWHLAWAPRWHGEVGDALAGRAATWGRDGGTRAVTGPRGQALPLRRCLRRVDACREQRFGFVEKKTAVVDSCRWVVPGWSDPTGDWRLDFCSCTGAGRADLQPHPRPHAGSSPHRWEPPAAGRDRTPQGHAGTPRPHRSHRRAAPGPFPCTTFLVFCSISRLFPLPPLPHWAVWGC